MTTYPKVPDVRVRRVTSFDANPDGEFVLYWMNAFRRTEWNFALQHAVSLALDFGKPLLVVEALRVGYRWASDRFHRFVIDGMLDNQQSFNARSVTYYPFLETRSTSGRGFIETLGRQSCVVVADDYPSFFHPTLYDRIVSRWKFAVELVDSNGIYPMRAANRTFTVAHSFRRHLQKDLPPYLDQFPLEDPLEGVKLPKLKKLPTEVTQRWPIADLKKYSSGTEHFSDFAINHSVAPAKISGGRDAAKARLSKFIERILSDYDRNRNVPDLDGASRLSPYLHFGHISSHEIFHAAMQSISWSKDKLKKPNGKAHGYWGATPEVEAFLDELITWREIGFNMCHREKDYDKFESLPAWAQTTLKEHANDKRPHLYSFEQLEQARTNDILWNAAQNELLREGRIHNYLRMLWGKKIMQWTPSPKIALEHLLELNNKYALDGRDPNSYSGIFWVFGRYDRAWGPERKIFGKVRYMTSDSTQRKFPMKEYIAKFAT